MTDERESTWRQDVVTALQRLGGTASLQEIYAEIESFRSQLSPTFKNTIRKELQFGSSDSVAFKGGEDLFFSVQGKGSGIWGLRSMVPETLVAVDSESPPERVVAKTCRILRDTRLVRQLKLLHRDQCQLCGMTLQLPGPRRYSEGHHLKPLGGRHRGPDVSGNILVLCPNHHVLCDFGAMRLDVDSIRTVPGHSPDRRFIDYHNEYCLRA